MATPGRVRLLHLLGCKQEVFVSAETRHGSSSEHQAQPRTSAGAPPHASAASGDRGEQRASGAGAVSRPEACFDDRPPASSAHEVLPGAELRQARERARLSLEDLSRITKIKMPVLTAIEASDVLRLPAAVYTRGFIKAYAREVGLDADQTAAEYLARIEPLTTQHLLVVDGELPPLAAGQGRQLDANDDSRQLLAANQARRFSRLALVGAAIGLVVYVASFGRTGRSPADDVVDAAALGLPLMTSAMAEQTPTAVPAMADVSIPMAGLAGPIRIEILSQGECWLSAEVDGERVVYKLLQPGDRRELAISNEAVLRVGDPGALSLTINGQVMPALGPAGQPVDIRITRDNVQDLISS